MHKAYRLVYQIYFVNGNTRLWPLLFPAIYHQPQTETSPMMSLISVVPLALFSHQKHIVWDEEE